MVDLRLTTVSRAYGDTEPVVALDGVSATIGAGEFVSIVGPSGSGKSTLLNVLGLIDAPTGGQYDIGDTASGGLGERERARLRSSTFGFVFQSFHLIDRRTARDNVELGLLYRAVPRARRGELAYAALVAVGLGHRADQETRNLSGGERQRVAIARATLGGAPVVLADEPTGNLDSASGRVVVDQLVALARDGATVVLVTHDSEVAAAADRRIVMADGQVVADERQPRVGDIAAESAPLPREVPGTPSRVRAVDVAREAAKAVAIRPGRAAAMVAAVSVACALVVATLGLSSTASAQVSNQFDRRMNRTVSITLAGSGGTAMPDTPVLPPDVERRMRALAGVTGAGVVEQEGQVLLAAPGVVDAGSTKVMAVSPGFLRLDGTTIRWGRGHAHRLGRHELLLGAVTAQQVNLGPIDQGPTVTIGGEVFGVAGIVSRSDRAPEVVSEILIGLTDDRIAGPPDNTKVLIDTVSGAAPQVARQAPLALDPIHPDGLAVTAPVDPSTLRGAIEGDLQTTLLALIGVATLASILGVANAMLMGIVERTGELGLRRAIGARPIHIVAQTALESLILGLLGGLVGYVLGMAATLVVTIAHRWQPVIDLRLVPVAVVGGAVVGVLGGSAASIRASRILPADALRR